MREGNTIGKVGHGLVLFFVDKSFGNSNLVEVVVTDSRAELPK